MTRRESNSYLRPLMAALVAVLLGGLLYYGFSGGFEYVYGRGDPEGRELFHEKCTHHHHPWRTYTSGYRGADWDRMVHRMQDMPHAEISNDEANRIIQYLEKTRG